MATIAFIDSGISIDALKYPEKVIQRYLIRNGVCNKCALKHESVSDKYCLGHGTMCVKVFETYAQHENYQIIDIQILTDIGEEYSDSDVGFGNIEDLCAALELCCDLDVDIISMSLGICLLSKSKYLNSIISKLRKKNIIMVAANSNSGCVSIPAVHDWVFGVRYDPYNILDKSEIVYDDTDFFNIQVSAAFKYEDELPSNSLTVPIVVARINQYINRGAVGFYEIANRFELEQPSIKAELLKSRFREEIRSIDIKQSVPYVRVVCMEPIIPFVIELMDCFFEEFGYESICLTDDLYTVRDVRCFCACNFGVSEKTILSTVEKYTKASIVFSVMKNQEELNSIFKADVVLQIASDYMCIRNEEESILYESSYEKPVLSGKEVCTLLDQYMRA